MAEYEHRFQNFSQEEKAACIGELVAHVTVKGIRLLSTVEIEKLLGLLPANYFRLLIRMRIRAIKRSREDFPDKFADFDAAVVRFSVECVECLDGDDDAARNTFLRDLDDLRLLHPALWLRVYESVWRERLDLAVELEAADKALPFGKP